MSKLMQLVDSYADDPYGLTTDHWLRISRALRLAVEWLEACDNGTTEDLKRCKADFREAVEGMGP